MTYVLITHLFVYFTDILQFRVLSAGLFHIWSADGATPVSHVCHHTCQRRATRRGYGQYYWDLL